jgi:adenylate cyclase
MKKILILPYHLDVQLKKIDYLSEGILEELLFLVSSNPNVKTTSRTTSLYLEKNPLPLNEIKERYNVDVVLEGNIKEKDGSYLISTRLFDTVTDELILSKQSPINLEKWTQPLDELVDEILHVINETTLPSPTKQKDISKARELYQRGLYHWHRYSSEEMQLAIGYFKKSIEENKSFALPHAGLADCYWVIAAMGYEQPMKVWKLAKESVKRALVLNNMRSESYVSAAFVNMFYERDFDKAKLNLEQALKLNSDNVKAHHALTTYFIHKGDLQNAEKYGELTIKFDPFALPHYTMMIRIQLYQKKFLVAMDYINAAWSIEPQALSLIELRGQTNLYLGAIESAIEDFTTCVEKDHSDHPIYFANLAYAYSKANFHQESREIEQQVYDLNIKRDTGLLDYALAIIKLGQSDYKSFFKYLKKAVESNIGFVPGEMKCNPMFSEVRKDPRFQELLETCNLVVTKQEDRKDKKPSEIIILKSNTSETLSFDPQDLSYIESSDNYSTIHWYESGVLQNKILRATLKDLEDQLAPFDYILRCHKSFIINLNEDLIITGNAKGHFFESPYLPLRIPISRSKSKSIKKMFENR